MLYSETVTTFVSEASYQKDIESYTTWNSLYEIEKST